MNINYKAILETFNTIYQKLYDGLLKIQNPIGIISEFDDRIDYDNRFINLIKNLVKERQDVFSSDREVIAIMLALKEHNIKL